MQNSIFLKFHLTFSSIQAIYRWKHTVRIEGPFCVKLHTGEIIEQGKIKFLYGTSNLKYTGNADPTIDHYEGGKGIGVGRWKARDRK